MVATTLENEQKPASAGPQTFPQAVSPEPFHVEGCHNRGIIVALDRLVSKLRAMVRQFCVVLTHKDSGLPQVASMQSWPDSVAQTREILIG
jgi:hypothetical protein